jgi:hypothetical protein
MDGTWRGFAFGNLHTDSFDLLAIETCLVH